MVFYRKYRPQKIEELDSSEVREKLYSVLESSSVPHAFLFTGPKGLGKTSTARIVAKSVNCEKNKGLEPCNKCDQCTSITNGTNVDVLEIDGASNRGIDEIRDLREKVKLSPAGSKKKVYIIDEVHMLTTEAFNALLKTLEEPPSHVLFILCTTEPHKVPATISSRCFHIQFNKATSEELVSSFERIIKSEKVKADKEALNLIASLSEGSFRDGSKILEEMVLAGGKKELTKELVEKKYQISDINSEISRMIEYLANRDTKKALDQTSKITDKGLDMRYFIEQLIQTFHKFFLQKAGVGSSAELKVKGLELEIEEIKRLIEIFAKAHSELKFAVLPQLPLEMAIVEWGIVSTDSRLPHVAYDARQALAKTQPPTRSLSERRLKPELKSSFNSSASGQAPILKNDDKTGILQELINKVKTYNHSIAGVLRGCRVISYDKERVVIEAGFKFHKERLDDPKAKEILRNAVSEITGKKVDVSVTLK